MFIKWEQDDGYVVVVPKKKISAYVIAPNGEITVYVSGCSSEDAFCNPLYRGYKEIAEKVMVDAMQTDKYIAELPTMENIKEYFNGQNKDN